MIRPIAPYTCNNNYKRQQNNAVSFKAVYLVKDVEIENGCWSDFKEVTSAAQNLIDAIRRKDRRLKSLGRDHIKERHAIIDKNNELLKQFSLKDKEYLPASHKEKPAHLFHEYGDRAVAKVANSQTGDVYILTGKDAEKVNNASKGFSEINRQFNDREIKLPQDFRRAMNHEKNKYWKTLNAVCANPDDEIIIKGMQAKSGAVYPTTIRFLSDSLPPKEEKPPLPQVDMQGFLPGFVYTGSYYEAGF